MMAQALSTQTSLCFRIHMTFSPSLTPRILRASRGILVWKFLLTFVMPSALFLSVMGLLLRVLRLTLSILSLIPKSVKRGAADG